jgi:diguanylate cyclase (GGDEF)-like protein
VTEEETAGEGESAAVVSDAMAALGLAAYCWTLASDEIAWSVNAARVLEAAPDTIRAGRNYAGLIDPASAANRYDAVMAGGTDTGSGVPFHIEYVFRPDGRAGERSLWVEDTGRWYAGPDGRPARVIGTVRLVDENHRRQQQLSALTLADPLTGLMNRQGLMEALERAIEAAAGEPSTCALLLAAIGNLTVVNEAYGFDVAEQVVAETARRLATVCRAGDAIARYSGSKFGLILHRCGEEDLASAAERFLEAMRESVVMTEAGPVWALLSIGAVVLPRHGTRPATAIARAEEALTQARKQPFDGFTIYRHSPERHSEHGSNARCASEIVRCLKEQRLHLAFQPVIDAHSRRPVFHEALLRLTDHAGESIPTSQLVPVAEKLGLVRLIDRAVVELAISALRSHPEARISINISGTTATDPRWFPKITTILACHRDVAERLIVEITETVALGDLSDTTRFVQQLKELGVMVAIDDFGAGYTSFRNLRAMPVEMLKIDGSFCRGLSGNSENRYFVRALIDLARAFGLRTVAEWVESEADAELLQSWGIDLMQGNLFGHAETLPPWPALSDEDDPLSSFMAGLDGELDKLRNALRLLDNAFHTQQRRAG